MGNTIILWTNNNNKMADSVSRVADSVSRVADSVSRVVDGEGRVAVSEGRVVDGEDRVAVSEGRVVDGEGRVAVSEGRVVDGEGRVAVSEGRVVDGEGRGAVSEGRVVDGEGRVADCGGRVVDGGGRVAVGGGWVVDGWGRVADCGGRVVDGGGRVAVGGGQVVDGGGRVADCEAVSGVEWLTEWSVLGRGSLGAVSATASTPDVLDAPALGLAVPARLVVPLGTVVVAIHRITLGPCPGRLRLSLGARPPPRRRRCRSLLPRLRVLCLAQSPRVPPHCSVSFSMPPHRLLRGLAARLPTNHPLRIRCLPPPQAPCSLLSMPSFK